MNEDDKPLTEHVATTPQRVERDPELYSEVWMLYLDLEDAVKTAAGVIGYRTEKEAEQCRDPRSKSAPRKVRLAIELAEGPASNIQQELLEALKEMRDVLDSCAEDTTGTPTESFFRSKVKHCDVVIAKAEGRS